jgi:hypothetical protein
MTRALEDCPSADPGFEPCPVEDCDGHMTFRRGEVVCSACGARVGDAEDDGEPAEADE